jgi:hypothetical protein
MNSPNPYWYLDRWTTKRLLEVLAQNDSRMGMKRMELSTLIARSADENALLRLRGEIDDLEAECSALVERIKSRTPQMQNPI